MSQTGKFVFSLLFVFVLGMFMAGITEAQQVKTYQEAITKGNQLLKQKKWLDAKAYFQMALQYKIHDPYATKKIEEIVRQLKSGENRDQAYYNVIDQADTYYDKDMLEMALKSYQKALAIIPNDSYALGKIKAIHKRQIAEKERFLSYHKFMKAGDSLLSQNFFNEAIEYFEKAENLFPNKPGASKKLALARQMQHDFVNRKKLAQKEIKIAGRYLLIRNYVDALQHYQKADSLIPGNVFVLKRIDEIRPKAKKQRAYDQIADEADRLYISKNYMAALEKYQQAQKLWPQNSYPVDMIAKVKEQLARQREHIEQNYRAAIRQADSLFKKQEMDNAKAQYNLALSLKPGEQYPKQQLAAIRAYFVKQKEQLLANYHSVIHSADSLFHQGQYNAAAEKYRLALKTHPKDPYPKQKLAEIDKKLAAIARQKELEAKYQALITEAKQLQANGHYDLAIKKYQQAQILKESDAFSAQQIAKIKKLLAQMQKQKELDDNYARQIILGQRLLQQKQLKEAKRAFANALEFKPQETLPVRRIHEIDSLIRQKIRQAQIEKEYRAAVQQGKQLYSQKQYKKALAQFKKANELKPGDTYSKKMIRGIQTTLETIARAKALQQAYDQSNTIADQLMKEQKYELAKAQYENSETIKPDESYPKKQIAIIDKILVRLAKEREQRYAAAVSRGDSLYNRHEYKKALARYKEAASIKPNEPYPGEQISACNTFIAQIVAQQTRQYNQAIAEADRLYAAKIYDKAIQAYQKAEKAKPDETYPATMIRKIMDYIRKNAIVDLLRGKTILQANQLKKLNFKAVPIYVRKSNYIYIKVHNITGKAFRILFTYGKDQAKNGGFVIQVPPGKLDQEFIVRVGSQYKWFSDNNDWIGIYPENNPIEISLVRISKSD